MPNFQDITGQRFNRLTIISRAENKSKETMWNCLCDCGNYKVIAGGSIKNGHTQSCGCISKEFIDLTGKRFNNITVISKSQDNTKKGIVWNCICACGNKTIVSSYRLTNGVESCGCLNKRSTSHLRTNTTEYNSWYGMKSRCYNKKVPHFSSYGGRGIKVCDRWVDSFENFFEDMGLKPTPKHSIDRIDNNGDYTPENCKWSSLIEQANNKRNNTIVTIDGISKTVAQWCVINNIEKKLAYGRIKTGWDIQRSVTEKVNR